MLNPASVRSRRVAIHASVPFERALPMALAVILAGASKDASAAAIGNLATSVGLLAAMIVFEGWFAHSSNILWPAGGLVALAAGALLTWRALRLPLMPALAGPAAATRPARRVSSPSVERAPLAALPDDLDTSLLTHDLSDHFVRVQRAWDANDMGELSALTTETMLEELRSQLREFVGKTHRTDVLTLTARLLAYESRDSVELVCVEFAGTMRESAECGALPFRELWMLERSKLPAAAWKLARQQAML